MGRIEPDTNASNPALLVVEGCPGRAPLTRWRAINLGLHRRVDPHLKPQFEHQQCPEPGVMIPGKSGMFIEQEADVLSAEQAALLRAPREQRIIGQLFEVAAKPPVNRETEAFFGR